MGLQSLLLKILCKIPFSRGHANILMTTGMISSCLPPVVCKYKWSSNNNVLHQNFIFYHIPDNRIDTVPRTFLPKLIYLMNSFKIMYSMLMEKITDLNVKETIISNNPCGRDVCSSYAAISEAPTDQSALQVTHQRLVRFSSQSL